MKLLIRILIIAVNVFVLAYLLPGIHIDNFGTSILVAVVLALLDFLVKPLLILLTLPATILTLGLFLFIINAIIILLDAYFVHGFKVDSFLAALIFSIFLSLANSLVLRQVKREGTKKS